MPNLATWKGYAKANNGDLVVWINQSEAPNLKAANSGFVCSAITRDWISSCRKYRSDRTAFVQSFRQYDDSGKLLGHSIPDHYLARQQEIKREIEGYTKRAEELRKKILVYVKEYPKEKDFRAALLESLKIYERIMRGGVDCIKFISETSIDKIMAALTTQITPAYFALSMKPADSDKGHVVGFEFRSDESTPSFPEIYQFIDANFGLFVFKDQIDMMDFVEKKIWGRFYQKRYTRFYLLEYDVGFGGFGLSPAEKKKLEDEALDKELAEFELELERQGGKDWWKKT
jgi:hypothetical protein